MRGMSSVLAYVAAAGIALWGVAHAVPTGRVLAGFAPVTADSRRVVLQEWLAEAFTMRAWPPSSSRPRRPAAFPGLACGTGCTGRARRC